MTVALVLDFPGATRKQYDAVVDRMHLEDGRMAPGGLIHVAGSYGGGWRVIDVWDGLEHFERFRDEQIVPNVVAVGMPPPQVRVIAIDEEKTGNGTSTAFVQCVLLPGLDRASFHATDDEIIPTGELPDGVTFHLNGPFEGGWCVIDGWASKRARDEFMEERVRPAMADAPLQGPPQIEDLVVEVTLAEGATAKA
jgi:hypothetical protein